MNMTEGADALSAAGAPLDADSVIATDEYAGIAGSFVFDPETGMRTPTAGPALEIATRPDTHVKE